MDGRMIERIEGWINEWLPFAINKLLMMLEYIIHFAVLPSRTIFLLRFKRTYTYNIHAYTT